GAAYAQSNEPQRLTPAAPLPVVVSPDQAGNKPPGAPRPVPAPAATAPAPAQTSAAPASAPAPAAKVESPKAAAIESAAAKAQAAAPLTSAPSCLPEIAQAEARYRIPDGLLVAIALVESGRRDPVSDVIVPWPWTINSHGEGHYFDSE